MKGEEEADRNPQQGPPPPNTNTRNSKHHRNQPRQSKPINQNQSIKTNQPTNQSNRQWRLAREVPPPLGPRRRRFLKVQVPLRLRPVRRRRGRWHWGGDVIAGRRAFDLTQKGGLLLISRGGGRAAGVGLSSPRISPSNRRQNNTQHSTQNNQNKTTTTTHNNQNNNHTQKPTRQRDDAPRQGLRLRVGAAHVGLAQGRGRQGHRGRARRPRVRVQLPPDKLVHRLQGLW